MNHRVSPMLSLASVALVVVAAACARAVTISTAPPAAPPTPAGAVAVAQRIADSPRRGEWAMIRTGPDDSVRAWVVYPQRSTPAPVVLVVHEIYGLSAWIRGVADQLAADGYIAIAPDLITGKVPLEADSVPAQAAVAAVRALNPDDVHRQLGAVARYGMNLAAAQKKYGIVERVVEAPIEIRPARTAGFNTVSYAAVGNDTAMLTIILMFEDEEMNLFNALCHAFGTMATGGFSTYIASAAIGNAQIGGTIQ